jgi:Pentapeptide repeats (9 copies)
MTGPTLERVELLLTILGQCDCVRTEVAGLPPGATTLALTRQSPFGQSQRRIVLARDLPDLNLDRWAQAESVDIPLLILVEDDVQQAAATALCERAMALGRVAHIQRWSELVTRLANLGRILGRYDQLKQEFEASARQEFRYIDPTVVDEAARQTARLFAWIDAHKRENRGGLVYLVAEYGEGKTRFCLESAFRLLTSAKQRPPAPPWGVPLLFPLNECEAGTLEAFVENRLLRDYGLALTYLQFRELCRAGLFTPVFDAFDQMRHGEAGVHRVARDHASLQQFHSDHSLLYVTCRLDYFNQQVQPLLDRSQAQNGRSRATRLLLRGFEGQDISTLLADNSVLLALLNEPANAELLGGIPHKPLLLSVIVRHEHEISELLALRRNASAAGGLASGHPKRLSEYDIFDLLYEEWLSRTTFQGFTDRAEAHRVCQAIAALAQLEAMNVPLPLDRLRSIAGLADRLDSTARRAEILADLRQLALLDSTPLNQLGGECIAFRFNIYLEFLTAHFVLEELRGGLRGATHFIRVNPLSWETRQLIRPNLTADDYSDGLRQAVESTRWRHFRDVEYQGGNALTLVLDKLQENVSGESDQRAWETLLRGLSLPDASLRRLDARGASLVGLDFSRCDLRDADFSYAVLVNVSFAQADLSGARFEEEGPLLTAAFIHQDKTSPEHWRLAGGTENGRLLLWDSTSPFADRSRPHDQGITALALPRQGGRVYSVSRDTFLGEVQFTPSSALRRHPVGLGSLRTMVLTGDGLTAVLGGDYRLVRVSDLEHHTFRDLQLPDAQGPVITAMALDEQRGRLYIGDSGGQLFLFRDWLGSDAGEPWGEQLFDGIRVLIALQSGGLLLLSDDRQAMLLDETGIEVPTPLSEGRPVGVCYAPDVDTLFWLDGIQLYEWQPHASPPGQRARIGELTAPTDNAAWNEAIVTCSADGRVIAAGGEHLMIWRRDRTGLRIERTESMRMDCRGLTLDRTQGLDHSTLRFLVERGARA